MNLYIYVTEDCKRDIQEHSIQKEVNQFKDRLIKSQRVTFFDNFPLPYLKKRFRRQLRLIASEKKMKNDIVLIFYRILVRGSREYKNFLSSPKEYGDNNFASLICEKELEEWLRKFKKENPISEKQPLSTKEYEFLYSQIGKDDTFGGDYFIFETYQWIKSVQKEKISNRLIRIPNELIEIIKNSKKDSYGRWPLDSSYEIVYKLYPERKILLLIDISEKANFDKINFNKIITSSDPDIVNRISGKSYPDLILADEDTWMKIEKNQESNLALSPEETELLRSVHKEGYNTGFPLFINGRAGSGKSTILQYLFADYLKTYNISYSNILNTPIYLTYSNALVKKTKTIVKNLLKYNYREIDSPLEISNEELNDNIQEFKNFLLNRVPVQDKKFFTEKNYIDYARFKRLWQDRFSKEPNALKNYNPDISWHVIRSYIKGISIDGYLEKDEYLELPKDEKSITPNTFNIVYDKVWLAWYKPLCENSLWDNQDLVRFLLDHDHIEPRYPAIFCDEAQDFTRIELELLLRLNIFTERKIDSKTLKKIPFAFAGDPFQTLNPTGFRWESIKSTYVEKFIHSLDPQFRYGNPDLNYQELTFNYRSSENIVKLCNSVQLLRMVLFAHHNIQPQKTWHVEEDPPIPVFFSLTTPNIKNRIREQNDLCIIIPCNEGEEIDFVNNDAFLNEIVEKDDSKIPQNVFSSMRAKGLEFPRILLYGFGKYRHNKLNFKENSIKHYQSLNNDEKITLEYFINQLYVAISRGQKRLFIVDESKTLKSLWKFASDQSFQEELLANCKNKDLWEKHIGNITQGKDIDWTKDRENPIVRAKQFEEEGKLKRDPYFLRQAALSYKSAGNSDKEAECRALALEFEYQYKKSGMLYKKCNNFQKALEVFWIGECYDEIEKMLQVEEALDLVPRLEARVASQILSNENSNIDTLLSDILEHFNSSPILPKLDTWERALNKLFSKIINNKNKNNNDDYWKKLLRKVQQFEKVLDISPEITAKIAFEAKNFSTSVMYFERAGETNSKQYKDAKLNVIIKRYNKGDKNFSSTEYQLLVKYFVDKNDLDSALDILYLTNMTDKIFDLLNSKNLSLQSKFINKGIKKYLESLANQGRWIELVKIFNNTPFLNKKVKEVFKAKYDTYLKLCVKELATSALLPQADNKTKEKVSDFLKEKFVTSRISTWKSLLTPEIIGAALERAGRDIDCLKFYEKIIKSPQFDQETTKRSQIRWIVVKFKQSDREEKNGLILKSLEHRNEAKAKIKEFEIKNIEKEPEFPRIIDLTTTTPIKKETNDFKFDDSEIRVGDIIINIIRGNNRINIVNNKNSYQAAIFITEKICKSIDFVFLKEGNIYRGKEIGVDVIFNDQSNKISIKLIKYGIQIDIIS